VADELTRDDVLAVRQAALFFEDGAVYTGDHWLELGPKLREVERKLSRTVLMDPPTTRGRAGGEGG